MKTKALGDAQGKGIGLVRAVFCLTGEQEALPLQVVISLRFSLCNVEKVNGGAKHGVEFTGQDILL